VKANAGQARRCLRRRLEGYPRLAGRAAAQPRSSAAKLRHAACMTAAAQFLRLDPGMMAYETSDDRIVGGDVCFQLRRIPPPSRRSTSRRSATRSPMGRSRYRPRRPRS
jgi:hypothetical protein